MGNNEQSLVPYKLLIFGIFSCALSSAVFDIAFRSRTLSCSPNIS